MFKFLLILSIIVYLIYKVGSFFFQAGAASQQLRNSQKNAATPKAKKTTTNVKGGEYIDYEEVK
jgi:hypothetical protein